MTGVTKLPISDAQLATVTEGAALLPPTARDNFMRSVVAVLDCDRPTDGEVQRALRLVLSERRVAVGKLFFTSGAPVGARRLR